MANVDVTFVSHIDYSEMDADLDDAQTAEQVIQALIAERFIQANTDPNRYYTLTIKGRSQVAEGQTLAAAGVQNGDRIIVSVAQRGGV